MPKFKITTSMSSVNYDYYEVEASTEEEAINLIISGKADAYDSEVFIGLTKFSNINLHQ